MERTRQDLKAMQNWSLWKKIQRTQGLIIEWYLRHEGQVFISFSGGLGSTVLLDIARRCFPDIPAVFSDTGLEYRQNRTFALSQDNVTVVKPKITFRQVIEQYGYPIISKEVSKIVYNYRNGSKYAKCCFRGVNNDGTPSKFRQRYVKYKYLTEAPFAISHKCCHHTKISPLDKYARRTKRKSIVGIMACESQQREAGWIKIGCNAFESGRSAPLSFWLQTDLLHYVKKYNIPYSPLYGEIIPKNSQISLFEMENEWDIELTTTACSRSGCAYCCFGILHDGTPNRFQRMKLTHPKLYEYCIGGGYYDANGMLQPDNNGLGIGKILDYIGVPY